MVSTIRCCYQSLWRHFSPWYGFCFLWRYSLLVNVLSPRVFQTCDIYSNIPLGPSQLLLLPTQLEATWPIFLKAPVLMTSSGSILSRGTLGFFQLCFSGKLVGRGASRATSSRAPFHKNTISQKGEDNLF